MNNQISFRSNNVFAPIQSSSGESYDSSKPYYSPQNLGTDIDKKNSDVEKSNKLGYEIAVTALAAGVGVLLLTKGMPAPARKQMQKVLKGLDKKANEIRQSKQITSLQKLRLKGLEASKTVAKYSTVIFDMAPLKDVLLHTTLSKIPGLRKFDKDITNVFRNVSVKKYERAYSKSLVGFDKMYADFAEANSKIKNEKAEEALTKLKNSYDGTFGATARRKRLNETVDTLEGFDKEIFRSTYGSFKNYIKNKIENPSFISEEKAAPYKEKTGKKVNNAQEEVTKYKNELLKFYEESLPDKEVQKLKKTSDKAFKKLDNAAKIEKDKLFDKLRDLAIGSAPWDILGIITSTSVIGWQLQKADNNDERVSIALKSGIPIVGGMMTSIYCALALVSAAPALFVGLGSGLAINKLGSFLDKYRKRDKDKHLNIVNAVKPEGLMPVKDNDKKTEKVKKSA